MKLKARKSIAPALLVAGAVSVALAACGGGSGNSADEASRAPAATTSPPAGEADPLKGEWRAEFTCRDAVRALERRFSAKQLRAPSRDAPGTTLQSVLRGFGGRWSDAEPTKDDPCHGAPGKVALVARFAGGNLALFDAGGELGLQARYELVGGHTISVDAEDVCAPSCPARWTYEIAADELTVRVQPNPYGVAAWEAAPWVRVS